MPAAPRDAALPDAALRVPGGTAGLAEALQLRDDLPRSRLLLTAVRVLWEKPEGADPSSDRQRAAFLEYLRGVDQPESSLPGDAEVVPGFLPSDAWRRLLQDLAPQSASAVAGILRSRRAALLYHGLASLDGPTLSYLLEHVDLLRELSEPQRVGAVATFLRSVRVREGRVEVPGGAEAIPLWEEVTGERVTKPRDFILAVLGRHGGRLALLYDGIAHLPDATKRFALGLHLPPAKRVDRFRALVEASEAALRLWMPQERPFQRETFDAVHLLLSMRVRPDGRPAGPEWPRFWEAAFAAVPVADDWPGRSRLERDAPLDAARVVELVCVTDAVERDRRAEMWLFAQRAFPGITVSAARDVLESVRGLGSYPALLLTLERMGISASGTYAAAVRSAARLARADRRLWQFQAALAILERARAARALDAQTADALVRKLASLTPAGDEPYRGAVARWLCDDLLAAAPESIVPEMMPAVRGPVETRLLAVMAGGVASPANRRLIALPPLEWEGLAYRIDPAQSTLRRLLLVRQRQAGVSLDVVLACTREADALATAPSAAAAVEAAGRLREAARELDAQASAGSRLRARPEDRPPLDPLAARALERARRLREPLKRDTLAGIARPLLEATDHHLADVLGSLAYTPHVGGADSAALLAGDPAGVHEFAFFQPGMRLGRRTAWELPVEVRDPGVGWRLSGSLLGLDLVLGRLSLPLPPREVMPPPPTLSATERETLTDAALLITAFDMSEEVRTALVAAVERGRQRVSQPGAAPAGVDRVAADAGLDEWRTAALHFTLAFDRDRVLDLFSLAELALAGGLAPETLNGLDAWGTSGLAQALAPVPVYPVRLPWTTMAGRRGRRSAVAAFVPDLAIGLAESSARMGLPAALTAGLVLVASREFMETVRAAHHDDWLAMVAGAQATARRPLDDYVAALTVAGPLVPDTR